MTDGRDDDSGERPIPGSDLAIVEALTSRIDAYLERTPAPAQPPPLSSPSGPLPTLEEMLAEVRALDAHMRRKRFRVVGDERSEGLQRLLDLARKTGRIYVAPDVAENLVAEHLPNVGALFGIEVIVEPMLSPGSMMALDPKLAR